MKTSQKKDVVIICGGTKDVAKNEAKDGLRSLYVFVKHTSNTNVIVTHVPHRFDFQPSSCVNKEVESLNRKLQKAMKTFSHVHVCSMSTNRAHSTSHGLHLNSHGKNWVVNKWASIITPTISKSRVISVPPLLWMKKSEDSYDEHEHRKELVAEGMNMPKERNSRSKEEIFDSAPELEVGREYSEKEGVAKEIPGLPTSKTSRQCKRIDEEDAKHIVPNMDITNSPREEEDK